MFDDDDWDSDGLQDFLKDADHKATQYYSQRTDENELPPKRRKVDTHNDSIFSFDDVLDIESSTTENSNKETVLSDTNTTSRKNLICSILSKNSSVPKNVGSTSAHQQETNKSQGTNNVQSNGQSNRKNLVLSILQRKDNTSLPLSKNGTKRTEITKTIQQMKETSCTISDKILEHKFKISNNLDLAKENYQLNENQCTIQKLAQLQTNQNQKEENKQDNSRRRLLLELLKKPVTKETEEITNNVQCKPVYKLEKQVSEKTTIVRRFPGPAGLLPDIMDNSFSLASHLKNLDENDNDKLKEHSDSNLSEYCSQNTKNLFTEGAWQIMLDDLPTDFLKGYEISRIKQIASTNSTVVKIPFLAGILERIDHSHENPPVILKDFTDSIQGIMHRDIPIKYPGLLEPSVVILLHDVGILRMKMSVTSKYHILISPSNLLAIYSAKGKILETPVYETVLNSDSKHELEKGGSLGIDKSPLQLNNLLQDSVLEHQSHTSNGQMKKSLMKSELTSTNFKEKSLVQQTGKDDADVLKIFEDFDHVENFNNDMDDNLCISAQDITDSQNQKNFEPTKFESTSVKHVVEQNNLLTTSNVKKSSENIDKSKTLLSTLKQFAHNKKEIKKISLETTISNATHSVLSSKNSKDSQLSQQTNVADINFDDSLSFSDIEDTPKPKTSSEIKEKPEVLEKNTDINSESTKNQQKFNSSIRSKLSKFKCDDVLTQEELPCSTTKDSTTDKKSPKNNKEQTKIECSSTDATFADDLLGDSENDTDDEMLSQLNIDEICGNQCG